nr:cytochrome c oxidase assembly protein [Microlunatus panaciterrae]
MHATPHEQPVPLTPIRLLTAWSWDWFLGLGLLVTAALYLWGVQRLRRRGDRWPIGRTVAFLGGGLGSAAIATLSALGTYDTVLLSVHMVQHMILAMMTPLFLALGAPVTLALRTLPRRARSALLTVVHSRVARVLTFPPLALALFVANPFALYYSDIYPITLASPFWHNVLHLHFVLIGLLFLVPLVGVDPVPGRVTHPLRLLLLFLSMPFHAFLGITIMSSDALIAEDWYLSFHRTWGQSPAQDQYLAGGILWGSGDVVALVFIAVLFVQWFAASQREALREDRRLDMLEAKAARAQAAGAQQQRRDTIDSLQSNPTTVQTPLTQPRQNEDRRT